MATGNLSSSNTRGMLPASTRTQSRVTLFQASQRPVRRGGEWQKTAFGRVRVSGRLGQRHADLVEALCATALDGRQVSDGGVELLVDPHKVRMVLAGGRGQYSAEQLQALLSDLRAARIEIETPAMRQGERAVGGLIDHWIPTAGKVPDPLHGQRQLWRVRLGLLLVNLLRADPHVWRTPARIAQIAALGSGVSQAVARHVLTHSKHPQGGWHLDTLLDAVGAAQVGRARRVARQAVRRDAAGLAGLGVILDEADRVFCNSASAGVAHPPGGGVKSVESVAQPPGGVAQPPGGVAQPPGGFSIYQDLSGS